MDSTILDLSKPCVAGFFPPAISFKGSFFHACLFSVSNGEKEITLMSNMSGFQ